MLEDVPSVVPLGDRRVVFQGLPVLTDLIQATKAAQRECRRDGLSGVRWAMLQERLEEVAASDPAPRSSPGTSGVPQLGRGRSPIHDLVDTKEAAAMFRVSGRYVRTLRTSGVLRSGRIVGGRLLFDRLEIEAEVARRAETHHAKERRT